jgi:hypothetical protein
VADDPRDALIEEQRRRIEEQAREIEDLHRQVAELERVVEEWKRGHRHRPRRFSSANERRTPRSERKRPGRKSGHVGAGRPRPARVDRTVPCAVTACPDCGGAVEDTGVVQTIPVEELVPAHVEVVGYQVRSGRCLRCRKRVMGALPAELGPSPKTGVVLQSLVVSLRGEFGLTMPQIVAFLGRHAGLKITEGGISQMLSRLAVRTEAARVEIEQHVRQAPWANIDETGWREDGESSWGWLVRTPSASLFRIDKSRGRDVMEAMIGDAFAGVLVSDFLPVYTGDLATDHQWCWAHLIREAKRIAEVEPKRRPCAFRERLRALHRDALAAQASQDASARHGIRVRFGKLIYDTDLRRHPDVRRLLDRMWLRTHGLLRFLDDPILPADNNAAERDLRKLVLRRKVSGGTRSPDGSRTVAHWLSVTQTLAKQGSSLAEYLPAALRAYHSGTDPPPIIRSPN